MDRREKRQEDKVKELKGSDTDEKTKSIPPDRTRTEEKTKEDTQRQRQKCNLISLISLKSLELITYCKAT
jgi:hypothetical protein